jgi:hypothetical protein
MAFGLRLEWSGRRPVAITHDGAAAYLGEAVPRPHAAGRGDQIDMTYLLLPGSHPVLAA